MENDCVITQLSSSLSSRLGPLEDVSKCDQEDVQERCRSGAEDLDVLLSAMKFSCAFCHPGSFDGHKNF